MHLSRQRAMVPQRRHGRGTIYRAMTCQIEYNVRKYASSVVEQNSKMYLNGERAKCIGVQREL